MPTCCRGLSDGRLCIGKHDGRRILKARLLSATFVTVVLLGCVSKTIHQEDLRAWEGGQVSALDTHPMFQTMQMVKTMGPDGTEIRHYVNGNNLDRCSGGGSLFRAQVNYASYKQFAACMQSVTACSSIFYINGDIITSVSRIGTGGDKCLMNDAMRPGFRGSVNIK